MLLAAGAGSHPSSKPGEDDHDHHEHAHPPGGHDAPKDGDAEGPSEEEKKQRIAAIKKRAEERNARREQIRKDRRQALRRRLQGKLEGQPLTAPMSKELSVHARRMARLRRVRYLSASAGDYDSIETVDKLIGKENARHEAWWRSIRRSAVQAAKRPNAAPPAGSANKAAKP